MKRHIVFISSTKTDLEKEREALIKSVIKLDHMPASMEYFPASNTKSWSYIQRVIDDSDYYVLILGARYGSIDKETGLSFTEREYRYARNKKIPTIAFLHADPDGLPSRHHDDKERLKAFYEYVKDESQCEFWNSLGELLSVSATSLVKLINDNPRTGWVKANSFYLAAGAHPASHFVQSNILPLLSRPYRESVEARVNYSETDDINTLRVEDEVSYKCRAIMGSIDRKIIWSFVPNEQVMESISIRIKRPTGEEKVLLHKEQFEDCHTEDGFRFAHEISDEWNVDNLLVVIVAQYVIQINHFVSWEMPTLTNNFALTMTYPLQLKLFHMPYLTNKDSNFTERPGFFSYKLYTWILPNEGLAWQFYRDAV